VKFNDKKVIIFDLDGTLINSAPDLALAVNHMLTSIGHKTFDETTIDGWVGNGAIVLVKRALSGSRTVAENIDNDLFEKALNVFLRFYAKNLCIKTAPYPNVLQTLNYLKSNGYRLAIVTNKPFDFVEPILKTLELIEYFEYFIGGDSLNEKKPSPLPLLHVCEKLEVTVDEALMVGDSKNDILASNACNMQNIGLTYGYNYGESIGVYNPSVICNDFGEIRELL